MYDIKNLTINSTNPCLIIYLIDQSGSMGEKFGNASHTKSIEVADAINNIIFETGLRCDKGQEIANRFELAVVGYGKDNDSVVSGWEGKLSGKWVVPIKNAFEYPLDIIDDKPIWIKPYANGSTPMKKAFENAKRLCNDWINWGNHKDCHPPIIINVTDGEATDSGSSFSALKKVVEDIKRLQTNYGSAIVLNIHISSRAGERKTFLSNLNGSTDRFAHLLHDMSSTLTENMVRIAQQKGYSIQENAKGYVFNGNANDLINFLNIGTPQ